MTATATSLNPFDLLAAELPPVIDGAVLLADGTYPGESVDPRDPDALRPGDFMFEQDVWLRVIETMPVKGGTEVRCGRPPGVTLKVAAGNRVEVWPMADVVAHVHAGGGLL